jgi:selenocysteine lyase/cysteine desulfurase
MSTADPSALALLSTIRSFFPGLSSDLSTGTIMLDNAGGSQLPRCVIDAMREYMEKSFVQLGGDYPLSKCATAVIPRAREVVKVFLGGHEAAGGYAAGSAIGAGMGDVFFGSSSTVLCYELAAAYADARDACRNLDAAPADLREHFAKASGAATGSVLGGTHGSLRDRLLTRDHIVVCTAGHEANVGPWMRLALRGYTIVPWHVESLRDTHGPSTGQTSWRPSLDTLRKLVNNRTLLVLMPQVSNILGEVWDVRAAAEIAHAAGARMVVDGVAYAPHRAPRMSEVGCDWYVYSTYKVFGPHMAAMFGTHDAMGELVGPNHYFLENNIPYKWELGNANHESAAGVAALWEYVKILAGMAGENGNKMSKAGSSPTPALGEGAPATRDWTAAPRRDVFERAFEVIRAIEDALTAQIIEYLLRKPGVRIVGPRVADSSRVGTISFTSENATPLAISKHLGSKNIGIRQGHAYSKRLVEALATDPELNIDPALGVARVSLQHYNTPQEVERLCGALAEIL